MPISFSAVSSLASSSTARLALAGSLAAVAFVLVDHSLIALVRRHSDGRSGGWRSLASLPWLGSNLALAALGVVIAVIWAYDSWLALFALAPLALVQRSLTVPRLQEEARVDPKTGLYNARHFGARLRRRAGARRSLRPRRSRS